MESLPAAYISIEVIIGLLAVAGNVLVLWAVVVNRRLRTITNIFIVSLAIADLLVGLVAIPCAIASFLGYPLGDPAGCVLVNSIVIVLTQASIFSLLGIAIERFVAIQYPFTYEKYFSIKNATIANIIIWILALLIGLIPLMGWNIGPPLTDKCAFTEVIDMKYMVHFDFFICVLVPFVIIIIFYGYIFHIVRRQTRQIAAVQLNAQFKTKRARFMREMKAAKALGIVIVFFALCWLPIHIMNSITVFCGADCNTPYPLLLAAIFLSHANSSVNPALYAYGNTQFRTTFRRIICSGNRFGPTSETEVFSVAHSPPRTASATNLIGASQVIQAAETT